MNVGSITYMNPIPVVIRPVAPVQRQVSPNITPSYPAAGQMTRGSNALFFNLDGDSVEISILALGKSLSNQSQPSSMLDAGNPNAFDPIGNELLKALETQRTCHTCENRRYVDQSDDASVSFQTPTKVSPGMAAAAVASHEQEHVRNEQAKAHRDDREVVSQTVTLTYDTCPECGKQYVSGGTTKTTTIGKSDTEDAFDAEPEE